MSTGCEGCCCRRQLLFADDGNRASCLSWTKSCTAASITHPHYFITAGSQVRVNDESSIYGSSKQCCQSFPQYSTNKMFDTIQLDITFIVCCDNYKPQQFSSKCEIPCSQSYQKLCDAEECDRMVIVNAYQSDVHQLQGKSTAYTIYCLYYI